MDFGDTSRIVTDEVLTDFVDVGYHLFQRSVNRKAAAELLADIRAGRAFDERLFLSEAEFEADPQHTGVSPRPGRNLLERFGNRLGFVEQAPHIVQAMTALLGAGYEILNREVVCRVPARSIPAWLKARIAGDPVNELGAYVRPEHRDVTYFYGAHFRQDLIEHQQREADFVTLYVYLHPVTRADSPPFLLEGSHRLGASMFPHDLARSSAETWTYSNGEAGSLECRQLALIGETGFAAVWHACTLHGGYPDDADQERISLRYLFAKRPDADAGIDLANRMLDGATSPESTRADLDGDGTGSGA